MTEEEQKKELGKEPGIQEKILLKEIEEEMKTSYLDYSMSVIVGRALPDVRDGLKPVHRRILYAMNDMGMLHNKPYKKSARIVGECFIKDTLVPTKKGLFKIQDIKKGDLVYTQKGVKKVTELYEMPEKSLLKIELTNGLNNIATESQMFKVLNEEFKLEWKEAYCLSEGDSIVLRSVFPKIASCVKLTNQKIFNENFAYLIGFFLSDGWIEKHTRRIGFYSTQKQIIEKLSKILKEEFGYSPKIEIKQKAGFKEGYQIRINKSEITGFLIKNFDIEGVYSLNKKIPNQIFKSPERVIFSFISGLIDGDGSVHKNRNIICYGSISETLINQLQLLFHYMGISCSRYSASDLKQHRIKDRVIKSNHRLYSLEISGKNVSLIADKLELSDPQKSENISLILRSLKKKSKFDNIPYASKFIFSELTKAHIGGGWYMDKNGKKFRLGIKYKDGCKIRYSKNLVNLSLGKNQIISLGIYKKLERIGSPFADFLKEVIDNNVTFLKIKKITKVMPQNTYDLQVEDDHEFIANGMVVHNCLGKYHPHGDTAVYDAMVRMAQSFSLRYPLVDGQGNFGSIDGDNPAAMRYTESRLSRIAEEMLQDIEKETVDFTPNFDNCLKEPVVLPSKLPNLLINGSSGIAVGMATTIPPHNLSETVDALLQLIDNSDSTVADLMEFIKGPDFPTAGIIQGTAGIKEAYSRGKGKITVRARTEIEETKTKTRIIVKEIPYMVNKAQLVESVADLIRDKIIQGISDIRDESDKKGMRVVFDLKSDSNSDVVLNQLFKHTRLESTFGVIMLALVDNVPRILTLKQMLSEFVEHRRVVVRRRTVYDLTKAEEKAHILEGLVIALSQLDLTIRLIKQSKSVQDAKISLVSSLKITEIQAAAILDMKLQRLTSLEQDKIREERKALLVLIEELKSILASDQKILDIIKKELVELKERYGDGRKTKIVEQESEDFEAEDLIKDEKVVVTVSHAGYIKRQPLDVYKVQARGGKGVIGAGTKEEDFVEKIFVASTHSYLLVFTSKGIVHGIKVHMVPDGSRTSKGKPIVNLIEIPNDEKVTAYVPVKHFDEKHFLFLATRDGTVKKTPLTEFEKLRKGGIRAITLEDDDQLISAKLTTGDREIIVATRNGLAVRFNEQDVRPIGRAGKGVRGINLKDKDSAIGMEIVKQGASLITVTENGYGKQTPLEEYRAIGRGGVGVINIQCTERNGTVVSIKVVSQDDEIMIMSQNGIVIRTPANGISNIGRNTQGVKLMKLEEGDKVIEMAKVISGDEKQLEKEIQAEENA